MGRIGLLCYMYMRKSRKKSPIRKKSPTRKKSSSGKKNLTYASFLRKIRTHVHSKQIPVDDVLIELKDFSSPNRDNIARLRDLQGRAELKSFGNATAELERDLIMLNLVLSNEALDLPEGLPDRELPLPGSFPKVDDDASGYWLGFLEDVRSKLRALGRSKGKQTVTMVDVVNGVYDDKPVGYWLFLDHLPQQLLDDGVRHFSLKADVNLSRNTGARKKWLSFIEEEIEGQLHSEGDTSDEED